MILLNELSAKARQRLLSPSRTHLVLLRGIFVGISTLATPSHQARLKGGEKTGPRKNEEQDRAGRTMRKNESRLMTDDWHFSRANKFPEFSFTRRNIVYTQWIRVYADGPRWTIFPRQGEKSFWYIIPPLTGGFQSNASQRSCGGIRKRGQQSGWRSRWNQAT
jgi:hypothetical protein